MLRPTTFIVRILQNEAGKLSGVVERVKTGEKQSFEGLEALGELIAGMMEKEQRLEKKEKGGEPK